MYVTTIFNLFSKPKTVGDALYGFSNKKQKNHRHNAGSAEVARSTNSIRTSIRYTVLKTHETLERWKLFMVKIIDEILETCFLSKVPTPQKRRMCTNTYKNMIIGFPSRKTNHQGRSPYLGAPKFQVEKAVPPPYRAAGSEEKISCTDFTAVP